MFSSRRALPVFVSTFLFLGFLTVTVALSSGNPASPADPSSTHELTCNGRAIGFESGIPEAWTTRRTRISRVYWTTTRDPSGCDQANHTGGSGEAACADADETNFDSDPYDVEMWTNPFSLSTAVRASLNFLTNFNSIDSGDFLDVDVSTDGGDNWINELSFADDFTTTVSLDLNAYAGSSSDLIVRFRYYGDSWDWWAQVDDVSLDCDIPGVDLAQTVSAGGNCADATAAITITTGTDVTFCYEVTNSGTLQLSIHDLEDDTSGLILFGATHFLNPGESFIYPHTVEVNHSPGVIDNVATWTAYTPDGHSASATATASITVEEYIVNLPLLIKEP